MMPEFRILYLQVSVTPIQSSATVGPADSDLLGDSYAADDDDDEDDDKVIEKIGSLKQQLTAVESRIAQQVCAPCCHYHYYCHHVCLCVLYNI